MSSVTSSLEQVLELHDVSQAYENHVAVRHVSLVLKQGQIGCLLGESGCGKTSLLRTIAGFEPVLAGQICLAGRVVSQPGVTVPADQRRIGMVFQDYALFPHLTVTQNIAFGLRGLRHEERVIRVNNLLRLVGLTAVREKYPHELSGGQQQRVALARALAPKPILLLFDEPFSNLDVTLRERLSLEVRDILKDQGITALLVTHNQQEAFAMADVIGVMREGVMLQWDTAYNLYHRPAGPFVAGFVGEGMLLPGRIADICLVETPLGMLSGVCCADLSVGDSVDVLIRPEDLVHADGEPSNAVVVRRAFRGPTILYTVRLGSGDLVQVLVPSTCQHAPGESIAVRPQVQHLVLFPR